MVLKALVLFTFMLSVPAQDIPLYDSTQDSTAEESEMRIEFHQRPEEEKRPPLEHPEFELMAQPCMGWHFQAGISVYNADAGRELLLLSSAVEAGGAALIMTAIDENASVMQQIPDTAGAWAMAPMKGDRVAIGTYYDGAIHIFDLPSNTMTSVVDIPGESYVWNLVEGLDGRLYGGTFPGGKLIALDQDTLAIKDCGQAGPPNRFLHQVSALPDGRLLCRVGTEAPGLRIYDPTTNTFFDAPEALKGVSGGTIWENYFITENEVFDAALQPQSPWPFPLPEFSKQEAVLIPSITTRRILYYRRGDAVYRYQSGDAAPSPVFNFSLRGGTLVAAAVDGGVIGIRGQQYFHVAPGASALERRQFQVASPPRASTFLRIDPREQVWGAPRSGQTLFFMDGETGVFVSMSSVTPRMGRIQDLTFIQQVAYGVSWPGGDIFRLDIEEPWNEWEGRNPRILKSLQDGGYRTPSGGIIASDSLLYSGWSAARGAYGGAIAITYPDTGDTRVLENPVGRQGITGLALDEQFLFIGTTVKGEEMPAKKDESPQFAVLGLDTVQPYWNHVFKDAVTVDRLCLNRQANRVALAVDDHLRVFDVNGMKIQDAFEEGLPEITSADMAIRQDPYVYFGHDSAIIRVHLVSGLWEEVIVLPQPVAGLAANAAGDLFAACGVDVYHVRFPEPYPDIQRTPEVNN